MKSRSLHTQKRRTLEFLERRECLTVGFTPHDIETNLPGPASVDLMDVDSDGDLDIIFAGSTVHTTAGTFQGALEGAAHRLGWYENVDGYGQFSRFHLISDEIIAIEAAQAADIDGDGLQDLVISSRDDCCDGTISWLRNVDGTGSFESQRFIARSTVSNPVPVVLADFDNDGDVDLITRMDRAFHDANSRVTALDFFNSLNLDEELGIELGQITNTLKWFENDNGVFEPHTLWSINEFPNSGVIHLVDIDDDGDLDLLNSASWFHSSVFLQKNNDGQLGSPQLVLSDAPWATGFASGDFDQDNDTDVLIITEEGTWWLENLDGEGALSQPKHMQPGSEAFPDTGQPRLVADLNDDGYLDIVLENRLSFGEPGGFKEHTNLRLPDGSGSTVVNAVAGGDIDNDGDIDLVLAGISFNNSQGRLVSWFESDLIETQPPNEAVRIGGDTNADGRVDFADFLTLAANYEKENDALWSDGDFTGDARVTFDDFQILAANYGIRYA